MIRILRVRDKKTREWTDIPAIKGSDGKTPYVGENGNWFIGTKDTGVRAEAKDGAPGIQGPKGDCATVVGSFSIPVSSWSAFPDPNGNSSEVYSVWAETEVANVSPALTANSIVQFNMDSLIDNNNVAVMKAEGTDTVQIRLFALTEPATVVTGKIICFNPGV